MEEDSNVMTPAETPTLPETSAAEPQSQPVQQVTRVTAETAPATSRSPKRHKDPKNVAAGRAGAAARRAKEEGLERELANAKESLRDPAFVAAPLHSNEEASPGRHGRQEEEKAAGSMAPVSP